MRVPRLAPSMHLGGPLALQPQAGLRITMSASHAGDPNVSKPAPDPRLKLKSPPGNVTSGRGRQATEETHHRFLEIPQNRPPYSGGETEMRRCADLTRSDDHFLRRGKAQGVVVPVGQEEVAARPAVGDLAPSATFAFGGWGPCWMEVEGNQETYP